MVILVNLATAAAKPTASPEKQREKPPQLDQKLVDDLEEWQKEYNEWLKGAAKTYTAAQ